MPHITTQIPNLQSVGPVLDLLITVDVALEQELQAAGRPIPAALTVLAMLDTGASVTVLQRGLASRLGLTPVGVVQVQTASAVGVPCEEYLVRLVFPNRVVFESTVVEAPMQGGHIQCLIGRDILSKAVLVYLGPNNLFSLST